MSVQDPFRGSELGHSRPPPCPPRSGEGIANKIQFHGFYPLFHFEGVVIVLGVYIGED